MGPPVGEPRKESIMKFRNIALSILTVAAMGSAAAADYSVVFDTNYNAAAHPEMSTAGPMSSAGMYFFEGYGVSLTNVLTTGAYTIDTTFNLDVTAYWRKVIDFSGRTSDNGLYENDGRISFYADGVTTNGVSTNITTGQDVRLTITRDNNSIVTAYLNGVQEFSFADTTKAATFGSVANFFIDDWVSGGYERSPGTVKYIQVFNHALSSDDVIALGDTHIGNTPAVPEPESLALALAGFLTVGYLMKRRGA
jgi:hypothetical protein